ncbi:MAG TPA: HDOD domain-containing protein [candidate division Zixibacteria bacterium]|nr:HDOD domain-containing protein [candidate division Zixibacteria bacterium]
MTEPTLSCIQNRIASLENIPSAPAILLHVIKQLEQPTESVDVQRLIDVVGHDKAIVAQVLRVANSPVFGQRQRINSIRGAVMNLGLARMRDIALSCSMAELGSVSPLVDSSALWEHSLACALVCRKLARRLNYRDPERAYLAGLLHDIGILVNMMLIPEQYGEVIETATCMRREVVSVEQELLGFTHATTGEFLANAWHLSEYVAEGVRRHHEPQSATLDAELVSIVGIADRLTHLAGLGLSPVEQRDRNCFELPAWQVLTQVNAQAGIIDLARFSFELESYVKEVRTIVGVLFRS